MKARILPPEEWSKLEGQYVSSLLPFARESDLRIIVAEDSGGRIVGSMGVVRMAHLEGFWLADEYKGNAGAVRALLRESLPVAVGWSAGYVLAGVSEPNMKEIVRRLDGQQLPVEFWLLEV